MSQGRVPLKVHDVNHPRCESCLFWTDLSTDNRQGRTGDCAALGGPNISRSDFYCALYRAR